jgi:hypothetical protein
MGCLIRIRRPTSLALRDLRGQRDPEMGIRVVMSRAGLQLLPRERYRGFDLFNLPKSPERELLLSKLDDALGLIAHFDPQCARKIDRSLQRLILVPGGGDHYSEALRAYMIDAPRLRTQSNTQSALNFVHEATHARIHRRGIRVTQRNIARIETLCVGQSVDFAARLPAGDELIARLRRTLRQPWWTPEREYERMVTRMELAGLPKWFIWSVTLPARLRGYDRPSIS